MLLWGGWTLIFASGETSIIDTVNRNPISWSDWVYFAGYTIFTLGNGDFAPQEGVWQILTTLATASGMLFITLSVTYVLNVLSAVTQKRSFASGVSGLGEYGTGILLTSWNGEEFEGLELPLNTFTTQLNTLTSNHKAYPPLLPQQTNWPIADCERCHLRRDTVTSPVWGIQAIPSKYQNYTGHHLGVQYSDQFAAVVIESVNSVSGIFLNKEIVRLSTDKLRVELVVHSR